MFGIITSCASNHTAKVRRFFYAAKFQHSNWGVFQHEFEQFLQPTENQACTNVQTVQAKKGYTLVRYYILLLIITLLNYYIYLIALPFVSKSVVRFVWLYGFPFSAS